MPPHPLASAIPLEAHLLPPPFPPCLSNTPTSFGETRKNCFRIPLRNVGKSFVSQLSRLYTAFATAPTLVCVALKATVVLPILVLQSPNRKSLFRETTITVWMNGDLESLVNEGRSIQLRVPRITGNQSDSCHVARTFANLMFKGKVHAALDLLSNNGRGGILHLDHIVKSARSDDLSVKDILRNKHPPPILSWKGPHQIFTLLSRSTVLRTTGAAGPSGLDAYSWRRLGLFTSLCRAIAKVAKRLCSEYVDPDAVSSLMSCRLIALDKCPGVWPICIGDTARRIIAKAVIWIAKGDIQDAVGASQLCAGQISGCEAAVHSVQRSFLDGGCEGALLVDASNAGKLHYTTSDISVQSSQQF